MTCTGAAHACMHARARSIVECLSLGAASEADTRALYGNGTVHLRTFAHRTFGKRTVHIRTPYGLRTPYGSSTPYARRTPFDVDRFDVERCTVAVRPTRARDASAYGYRTPPLDAPGATLRGRDRLGAYPLDRDGAVPQGPSISPEDRLSRWTTSRDARILSLRHDRKTIERSRKDEPR